MQKKPHDDSKACLTAFNQASTVVVVIEMSLASWLVAGLLPGVDREPLKKIAPNPELPWHSKKWTHLRSKESSRQVRRSE
jgi:hypothetical protein